MHPKYDVFHKAIEALNGQHPDTVPGWAEGLIANLLKAGATTQDLMEISAEIKRNSGRAK